MITFDETVLEKRGCEVCMTYDWNLHKEIEKDTSLYRFDNKPINFCPFCGRRINQNLKNS